jgi:hypothetical protein
MAEVTIAAGLSATKTGFDLIKSLREVLGRGDINPGDVQARLVELQSLLLDAQRSLSDAQEETRQLIAANQELRRMAEIGGEFTFEEGVYWRERAPYCPICWDTDRRPVRLTGPMANPAMPPGRMGWTCPLHKGEFAITRNRSLAVTSPPSSSGNVTPGLCTAGGMPASG